MKATKVSIVDLLFVNPITAVGALVVFIGNTILRTFRPRMSFHLFLKQCEFTGNLSIGIMILAGIMIGAVFGLQFGEILKIFGAEGMIGAAAGFALSKELAPVIGSFLVTARAGSSMAAEIATMRVNEQVDAMRVMAVNPYNYLVAPRIWASVAMMPLLTCIFVMSGVTCSFAIAVLIYDVDIAVFNEKIQWIVKPRHLWEGMQKAMVFGLIFSSVGCYKGFHAGGGAKGVGRATTEAVVISLVTILVVDFFMSYFQFLSAQDGLF
ncbi:MAG: ABC transporter permease [Proteobacteria bacterium]|nr:ABC transporter permease [Pseudomonadota bacterium]